MKQDGSEPKRTYVTINKDSEPTPSISIDDTIKECLISVKRIVGKISADTSRNVLPPRETVMTLKDCLSMLLEVRKKEQELLDSLSDEEVEKYLKNYANIPKGSG